MKNQYIFMLTDEEAKSLIETLKSCDCVVNTELAELVEKQANFYVKKAEVDAIAEDIQNLLK